MKIPSIEEAIEEVSILLYKQLKSTHAVSLHLISKYGLSKERAYDLIRITKAELGKLYNKLNEDVLADALQSIEAIRDTSLANNDRRTALASQIELNKLHQLYIERHELNVNIEQPLFNLDENNDESLDV
jgi:ribosomal protein S13